MEENNDLISLNVLIEILEEIAKTLENDAAPPDELSQLKGVLLYCLHYLKLYKNSVKAIAQIKESMEKLQLKTMPIPTKFQ